MKIRITGRSLPKAQWGGNSDPKSKDLISFTDNISGKTYTKGTPEFELAMIQMGTEQAAMNKFKDDMQKESDQMFGRTQPVYDLKGPANVFTPTANLSSSYPWTQPGQTVGTFMSTTAPQQTIDLTNPLNWNKTAPTFVNKQGLYDSTKGFVTKQDTENLTNQIKTSGAALQKTFDTGSAKQIKQGIADFNQQYNTNLKTPGLITFGAKGRETMGKIGQAADMTKLGIGIASSIVGGMDAEQKKRDYQKYMREQQLSNNLYAADNTTDKGDYNTTGSTYGAFRPDQLQTNPGMYADNGGQLMDKMKIRITGYSDPEQMAYGGQIGFGLDLGRKKVYTQASNPFDAIGNTMPEVPEFMANVKAEKGETLLGDVDGDGRLEHMNIQGDYHSAPSGGTNINAPQGSFIYSRKLKETRPEVLAKFGKANQKSVSYADLAKQYDINKYKSVVDDPNTDPLAKKTAQMMINKHTSKLQQLAEAQEGGKGFPDGAPNVQASIGGAPQFGLGGFLQRAQNGKMIKTHQPAFTEMVINPKKKEDYNLIYPQGFGEDMPATQHQSKTGVYGTADWTDAAHMADFKKRFPEFIKENPKWDPTKKGETKKFQVWYAKNVDPTYFSGKEGYALDDKYGQHTWSAPRWDKKVTPAAPPAKTPPEEQVALQPGKGSTTPRKEAPYKYLLPDKMNFLAATSVPPQLYHGYVPSVAFELPTPTFESPERALAANSEQARMQSELAAMYGHPDTSIIQGKAAEQAANIIADVNRRNVGVANQFEVQRNAVKNQQNELNAQAAEKRSMYNATANQNYDNAKRAYYTDLAKSYSNMWNNRMNMGQINDVNPYYFTDPTSGKTIFKGSGTTDVRNLAGFQGSYPGMGYPGYGSGYGSGMDDAASLGTAYNNMYSSYMKQLDANPNLSPDEKKDRADFLAKQAIVGSKQTSTWNPMTNRGTVRSTGWNF